MTDRVLALVGAVGELFQGDMDAGRHVYDRLSTQSLGDHVVVEEWYHGAVDLARELEDRRPDTLVMVGAAKRGREPGSVHRRWIEQPVLSVEQAQQAVGEALTGYVGIDLVVEVGAGFEVLPPRVIAVEVEPLISERAEELSPTVAASIDRMCDMVRREVELAPLFELVRKLSALAADGRLQDAPARETLLELLDALADGDREAVWGRSFSLRDQLRLRIADGLTGEGMEHLDWSLWWALIEELDRLERLEASVG